MLNKLHHRAVKPVDMQRRFGGSVHSNLTDLLNLCEGQDVSVGLFVVPHLSQIWEVSNHGGILIAVVCKGLHRATTTPNFNSLTCRHS
jgi:hypothetical protein